MASYSNNIFLTNYEQGVIFIFISSPTLLLAFLNSSTYPCRWPCDHVVMQRQISHFMSVKGVEETFVIVVVVDVIFVVIVAVDIVIVIVIVVIVVARSFLPR